MSDRQLSEQELVQVVYRFAAEKLGKGFNENRVVTMLEEKGVSSESAKIIVSTLAKHRREARRAAGIQRMLIGLAWCAVGLLVTGVTVALAADGGTYVVAYGAIIVGGIQALVGLLQWLGG